MSRTMHDSVTAGDIPADAAMVGGYVTGRYAWSAADWARFPNAAKVEIATQASFNTGDVLDVEKGDATPDQAPGWIKMRRAAGLWKPTIYCEASSRGAVETACAHAGLTLGNDYDLWVAHYTGHAHNEPGSAATQYADPVTSGGHFDLSSVADDAWPHRTPPTPAPTPTPPIPDLLEDSDMPRLVHWDGADYLVGYDMATGKAVRRTIPNLSREAQLVGGGGVTTDNGAARAVTNDQFLAVYGDLGEA